MKIIDETPGELAFCHLARLRRWSKIEIHSNPKPPNAGHQKQINHYEKKSLIPAMIKYSELLEYANFKASASSFTEAHSPPGKIPMMTARLESLLFHSNSGKIENNVRIRFGESKFLTGDIINNGSSSSTFDRS